MIEADNIKSSFFKYFLINLDSVDHINEIKEKLSNLEEGNKKILICYKDIEISSGLTINADVNLKNIMGNVKGIKNIEKIM